MNGTTDNHVNGSFAPDTAIKDQPFHVRAGMSTFRLPSTVVELILVHCEWLEFIRLQQVSQYWKSTVKEHPAISNVLFNEYMLHRENAPDQYEKGGDASDSPFLALKVIIQPHPDPDDPDERSQFIWTVCQAGPSIRNYNAAFENIRKGLHSLRVYEPGQPLRLKFLEDNRDFGKSMELNYKQWKNIRLCEPPVHTVTLHFSFRFDGRESFHFASEVWNDYGVTSHDVLKCMKEAFGEWHSLYIEGKLAKDIEDAKLQIARLERLKKEETVAEPQAEASVSTASVSKNDDTAWCCPTAALQQACDCASPTPAPGNTANRDPGTQSGALEGANTTSQGESSTKASSSKTQPVTPDRKKRFDTPQTETPGSKTSHTEAPFSNTPNEVPDTEQKDATPTHALEFPKCCNEGSVQQQCVRCEILDLLYEHLWFSAGSATCPPYDSALRIRLAILKERALSSGYNPQDDYPNPGLSALSHALNRIPAILEDECTASTALQLYLDTRPAPAADVYPSRKCCPEGAVEWQCADCGTIDLEYEQAWHAAVNCYLWTMRIEDRRDSAIAAPEVGGAGVKSLLVSEPRKQLKLWQASHQPQEQELKQLERGHEEEHEPSEHELERLEFDGAEQSGIDGRTKDEPVEQSEPEEQSDTSLEELQVAPEAAQHKQPAVRLRTPSEPKAETAAEDSLKREPQAQLDASSSAQDQPAPEKPSASPEAQHPSSHSSRAIQPPAHRPSPSAAPQQPSPAARADQVQGPSRPRAKPQAQGRADGEAPFNARGIENWLDNVPTHGPRRVRPFQHLAEEYANEYKACLPGKNKGRG